MFSTTKVHHGQTTRLEGQISAEFFVPHAIAHHCLLLQD
jgi:hypothetical protein